MLAATVALAALASALISTADRSPAAPARAAAAPPPRPLFGPAAGTRPACAAPGAGRAACLALLDTDAAGRPVTRSATQPAGASRMQPYLAADLQAAYKLPSTLLGARQTIAIIDAYDDPNAEQDLAAYRDANGLPPCNAGFPCFGKVDQRGGTGYPQPDPGWAVEISLDLDMASAACPNCQLLLVEADDNNDLSLALAVDTAVKLGANVVSNSYGALEYGTELADLSAHFAHPGTTIVASSGDAGFGWVQVPAALPGVVAVGGTTLYRDGSARGWSELAWSGTGSAQSGSGSGCSAYAPKPSWQRDRLCDKRTVADVAAVADPATPVAVYDSYDYPGWITVGGTSAAAPLVAGVYALAGNAGAIAPAPYLYGHSRYLFDVTSGSTGSCGGGYLCAAVRGYDGPTGLGTPNGTGAF